MTTPIAHIKDTINVTVGFGITKLIAVVRSHVLVVGKYDVFKLVNKWVNV